MRSVPQQNRSRDSLQRLYDAGHDLLAARDIDAISVQEITRAAGCSVGSFYFRFKDKNSFFLALIDDMITRRQAAIAQTFAEHRGIALASALASGALLNYRRHAGLLRSVIKKHIEGESAWWPINRLGDTAAEEFIRTIREDGTALSDEQTQRVLFSFSWLYGQLTTGLLALNRGPTLHDASFEADLVRNFRQSMIEACGLDADKSAMENAGI